MPKRSPLHHLKQNLQSAVDEDIPLQTVMDNLEMQQQVQQQYPLIDHTILSITQAFEYEHHVILNMIETHSDSHLTIYTDDYSTPAVIALIASDNYVIIAALYIELNHTLYFAELYAVYLATNFLLNHHYTRAELFCDYQSVIKTMTSVRNSNYLVHLIQENVFDLAQRNLKFKINWIPGYQGSIARSWQIGWHTLCC
ncbi:unnamed protein product [Didymodactylos carnosus]|uniref:RNase H type-1 domain-containing protein n=1 Tax=Didymodactylos carnosus TaxID=1234261 RepID=A0A815RLQ2_9BILA|nr:unnamed protein product [Didymodactylos carnosus]CAF4344674.1 unnamed protein product [Didymodactylos carnosus]